MTWSRHERPGSCGSQRLMAATDTRACRAIIRDLAMAAALRFHSRDPLGPWRPSGSASGWASLYSFPAMMLKVCLSQRPASRHRWPSVEPAGCSGPREADACLADVARSCVPEQPGDRDGPLSRGARSGLLGCWLVGEREDPAVERLGFHEPQRQSGSPAVKEALAAAKDDREQQQPQLVDQTLVE
jgi:hypothetical protein